MDLGKVSKVKIRHDNSGLQSSWYLDKITIMEPKVNTFKITFSAFSPWFNSHRMLDHEFDGKQVVYFVLCIT